ncbi:MAG: UPF0449 family protein [Holosporales bacterium]|nr:UPF0449 family protein [Holosporales bacterium]
MNYGTTRTLMLIAALSAGACAARPEAGPNPVPRELMTNDQADRVLREVMQRHLLPAGEEISAELRSELRELADRLYRVNQELQICENEIQQLTGQEPPSELLVREVRALNSWIAWHNECNHAGDKRQLVLTTSSAERGRNLDRAIKLGITCTGRVSARNDGGVCAAERDQIERMQSAIKPFGQAHRQCLETYKKATLSLLRTFSKEYTTILLQAELRDGVESPHGLTVTDWHTFRSRSVREITANHVVHWGEGWKGSGMTALISVNIRGMPGRRIIYLAGGQVQSYTADGEAILKDTLGIPAPPPRGS